MCDTTIDTSWVQAENAKANVHATRVSTRKKSTPAVCVRKKRGTQAANPLADCDHAVRRFCVEDDTVDVVTRAMAPQLRIRGDMIIPQCSLFGFRIRTVR